MKFLLDVTIPLVMLIGVTGLATALPEPRLEFKEREEYATGGKQYIRYRFKVTNYKDFAVNDDEIFKPSPDLPPCGINKNSSRSWVSIYDATTNQKINSFCAFGSSNSLNGIWFAQTKDAVPITSVYIEILDRLLKETVKSNIASVK